MTPNDDQSWRSLFQGAWISDWLPLLLAAVGLGALYMFSARPVDLIVDGERQQVRTHARTIAQALEQAGIGIGQADRVTPAFDSDLDWTAAGVVSIVVDHARPVTLTMGGDRHVIQSPQLAASNLLSAAGWMVYPGDRLTVDGLPAPDGPFSEVRAAVQLKRAVPITLVEGSVGQVVYSAASTVGEALVEAGLELHQSDRLTPAAATQLRGPLTVRLQPSRSITIHAGQLVIHGRSAASTIAEALEGAGVQLVGLDYAVPAADGPIPADGNIRVVRVRETVTFEQQPLPFETRYQPLETLEIDQQRLVEAGSYGVRTNRVRVRFEDGQEVERAIEGDWIAQEASDQVIGYGTQIVIRTVSTADGPLEYWRAVEMYATSYSPSRAGVSPSSPSFGITASGKPLKKGLVAIDRSLIPFGTQMYVPGYGFAEAADTGGGVKGRWIDLGYSDDNWVPWSGYVTVYFLTPVPGSMVYVFP